MIVRVSFFCNPNLVPNYLGNNEVEPLLSESGIEIGLES
jgi:hypothetical protein